MRHSELPPLSLLLTFEAAARHLSFKEAARELSLTPSAISQQIRRLEGSLKTPLFVRRTREVVLTDAGDMLLDGVRRALEELSRASRDIRRARHPVVRLSVIPFMAHELVIPHLARLRRRIGEVDLRVESTIALAEIGAGDVDVAIRFGVGDWADLVAEPLGSCEVAPVCAPALVKEVQRNPRALPWVSVAGRTRETLRFARHIGINLSATDVITFSSYFETVRAAEQGVGVAPAIFPLTSSWVHAGRLALPWPDPRPLRERFYVVWSPRAKGVEARLATALGEAYAQLPALASGS